MALTRFQAAHRDDKVSIAAHPDRRPHTFCRAGRCLDPPSQGKAVNPRQDRRLSGEPTRRLRGCHVVADRDTQIGLAIEDVAKGEGGSGVLGVVADLDNRERETLECGPGFDVCGREGRVHHDDPVAVQARNGAPQVHAAEQAVDAGGVLDGNPQLAIPLRE